MVARGQTLATHRHGQRRAGQRHRPAPTASRLDRRLAVGTELIIPIDPAARPPPPRRRRRAEAAAPPAALSAEGSDRPCGSATGSSPATPWPRSRRSTARPCASLQTWNGLRDSRIAAGDTLTIYTSRKLRQTGTRDRPDLAAADPPVLRSPPRSRSRGLSRPRVLRCPVAGLSAPSRPASLPGGARRRTPRRRGRAPMLATSLTAAVRRRRGAPRPRRGRHGVGLPQVHDGRPARLGGEGEREPHPRRAPQLRLRRSSGTGASRSTWPPRACARSAPPTTSPPRSACCRPTGSCPRAASPRPAARGRAGPRRLRAAACPASFP